jgi:hypothetical protein
MKKWFGKVSPAVGIILLVEVLPSLANAPAEGGPPDYSGITGMYYTLIAVILAYGIYDTFLKKS